MCVNKFKVIFLRRRGNGTRSHDAHLSYKHDASLKLAAAIITITVQHLKYSRGSNHKTHSMRIMSCHAHVA